MHLRIAGILLIIAMSACAREEVPGPDKIFEGEASGALVGAGAGAVTGFQVGAGTGPGAAVGAGFGALAGGIRGFVRDQTEENLMELSRETQVARQRAIAQEILSDQYKRRLELHPTREIYPADLFFYGDQAKLRKCAKPLIQELALMNKSRLPWSRLQITVYTKSRDKNSAYAHHLSERRGRAFGNELANAGIEDRRIDVKGIVIDAPLLLDPQDDPQRYNQAIEIIPLDR